VSEKQTVDMNNSFFIMRCLVLVLKTDAKEQQNLPGEKFPSFHVSVFNCNSVITPN